MNALPRGRGREPADGEPDGAVVAGRSVVVGVDGSEPDDGILVAAAALADLTGFPLVAVHVAHVPTLDVLAPTVGAAAAEAAQGVADYCHVCCELILAPTSVAWSFEVRRGDPATELRRTTADHDAVCVVVGRHSGALSRLVLGSVAKRLILHADRAVIVVPPEPWCPSTCGPVLATEP